MKNFKVIKAVIPAAGLGTRFLPATKAMPKEMLPIVNIPSIQLIVEEAVKSGINEILIIVSSSKNSIIDHFDYSYELEQRLLEKKKIDEFKTVRSIAEMVNIHYIRQKEPKGLGHAVLCAKSFVGNEPFAVLLGDDIVVTDENKPTALKQCIDAYEKTGKSVVGVQQVERKEVKKYGIIKTKGKKSKDGVIDIGGVVEKPEIKDAPSNLAILGRYVFSADMFSILEKVVPDKSGEIQLTDGISRQIQKNGVCAQIFEGRRYDIGSKRGFVIATIDFALKDKEISEDIKKYLKKSI